MRLNCLSLIVLLLLSSAAIAQDADQKQSNLAKTFFDSEKIVFIGDSITYHGRFLATLESCIVANGKQSPKLLNLGLSSETCSGDSEPAHPWPRPNVNERLGRLLAKLEPDLLVVTYGMNDGIYHPFDEKRLESYQAGIDLIIDSAANSDKEVKVILVTPPPFDALPVKQQNKLAKKGAKEFSWKAVYENYDTEVLAVYSRWILEQESRVAGCIDLRTSMMEALKEERKTDPKFHFADDGVHLDNAGHKIMGNTIAKAMGLDTSKTLSDSAQSLIHTRNATLRDSWLTTIGHKRPDIKKGLGTKAATKLEKRLNYQLSKLLANEKKMETKNQ